MKRWHCTRFDIFKEESTVFSSFFGLVGPTPYYSNNPDHHILQFLCFKETECVHVNKKTEDVRGLDVPWPFYFAASGPSLYLSALKQQLFPELISSVSCRTTEGKFRIQLRYNLRTRSIARNLGSRKMSTANDLKSCLMWLSICLVLHNVERNMQL